MNRTFWLLILGFSILQLGCAGKEKFSGRISSDTSWSGKILLEGDVYIEPGVTLDISPGTEIYFTGGEIKSEIQRLRRVDGESFDLFSPHRIEIIVAGDINIRGTEEDPVIVSAPPEMPQRAGGFNFVGQKSTSGFKNVNIYGGHIAVRVYDSRAPVMENVKITGNAAGGIGVWDRGAPVIKNSVISGNKYGIGAGDTARVEIRNTVVENNSASGVFFEGYSRGGVYNSKITGNDVGVAFGHHSEAVVENSTIAANGSGMGFWQNSSAQVRNNYFSQNITGAIAHDESRPQIRENRFENNGGGITFSGESAARVEENTFTGNGPGIISSGRSSPSIRNNSFRANRYAVRGEGDSAPEIYGNLFSGNAVALYLADFTRAAYGNNTFEENTNDIIDNRLQ